MYVKIINGYIVVVFVDANGNVETAFIPLTGRDINKYSDEKAIEYILRQISEKGFRKIYESNRIIPI
jgi:hypothetical protein